MSGHHESSDSQDNHGSLASYLIGFVLSVLLTIIPFYLVMENVLEPGSTILVVALFAVVQLIVQCIFFLHLDFNERQHWVIVSITFTVFISLLIVGMSIWIIWHQHKNMMIG